jgi:hypothetical protein
MGFTLVYAPPSTCPHASTPTPHCCDPSACCRQTADMFRPCGSSPLRRFTPRSARRFIAPDYRQGFATSAPSTATEVGGIRASGDAPPRKSTRRFARIAARTSTRPWLSSNPNAEAFRNVAHTIPPSEKVWLRSRESPFSPPPEGSCDRCDAREKQGRTRVPIASPLVPKHC